MRVYFQYSAPLLHYLNSTFQKGANKGHPLQIFLYEKSPTSELVCPKRDVRGLSLISLYHNSITSPYIHLCMVRR
nr:MAG TPA: hypothetical protein [Caudoviricetes sp.]